MKATGGMRDRRNHISVIATDDPITCVVYAKEHDLLALHGWERFTHLVKHDKTLTRAIKQSKIRQVRRSQNTCFGILSPETIIRPWNFINKITTVSGMMPQRMKWIQSSNMEYSRLGESCL